MNSRVFRALCMAAGLAAFARAEAPAPEPLLPESFKWFSPPDNPVVQAAWVVGAESEPALYALRVRLEAGGRIAPHTHPDTRYSTMLSGTLYVGFGAVEDPSAMVAVPAGADGTPALCAASPANGGRGDGVITAAAPAAAPRC